MDSHKQMFENGDKASLFRGECRVKAKVFHMKGEWLKVGFISIKMSRIQW